MDSFIQYQRRLSVIICGLVIVGALALLVIFPSNFSLAAGLLWGGIGGAISFRLKVLAVLKFAENPQKPPVKGGILQVGLMILFIAAAAVVNRFWARPVLDANAISLWTDLVGLVLPNFVLIADGMIRPAALSDALQNAAGIEKSGDHNSNESKNNNDSAMTVTGRFNEEKL